MSYDEIWYAHLPAFTESLLHFYSTDQSHNAMHAFFGRWLLSQHSADSNGQIDALTSRWGCQPSVGWELRLWKAKKILEHVWKGTEHDWTPERLFSKIKRSTLLCNQGCWAAFGHLRLCVYIWSVKTMKFRQPSSFRFCDSAWCLVQRGKRWSPKGSWMFMFENMLVLVNLYVISCLAGNRASNLKLGGVKSEERIFD